MGYIAIDDLRAIAQYYVEYGFAQLSDEEFAGTLAVDTGKKKLNFDMASLTPGQRVLVNNIMHTMKPESK